jgi:serine/threonine protein phosphatase PrpC
MAQLTNASGQPDRPALTVRSFGMTDRGKVRPANEDHFLIAELTKAMHIEHTSLPQASAQFGEERGRIFLVADGMGGHQGGEAASALAIVSIEKFALNTLKWFFPLQGNDTKTVTDEFQTAMREADENVVAAGDKRRELRGMGTTLTMAYSLDSELFIVHVGDSRVYVYRKGELHQITHDHTLVAEMVERGEVAPDQAATHRLRHVITNVIGGAEAGVRVEVHKLDLQPIDRILLCTDGLAELSNDQIASVLASESDPEQACKQLVKHANEQGGRDNITVILADFSDAESRVPPGTEKA